MNCLSCQGSLELAPSNMYARCTKCQSLFMSMNGTLTPYAVDEAMRPMMEQALGFAPSRVEKFEAPKVCTGPACMKGVLEHLTVDSDTVTRCPACGLLSRLDGRFLIPIVVEAPGGGWNAEFQAIFEEKLGFKKRVRKNPPGVPGP